MGADYTGPLSSILNSFAKNGKPIQTIRIHYRDHGNRPSQDFILRNAGRWTRNLIPAGIQIDLVAWAQHNNGEQFHDRFVISERGGIQFGAGLGAVAGNENVTVTLLDTEHAAQIRAKFANTSKIYQKVGSTIRIHTDGKVEAV